MKKFVAPLQALAALLLCSGMAWMIFVLASINPTPPTITDLQARNTQDLSFANMNSTAVALAQQMLANMVPSPAGPIFLPVTGRETVMPTPSAVMTLKSVAIVVNTPTPTRFSLSPTATRKKKDTPVLPASTFAPTQTPLPPTVTPFDTATTEPTAVPTQPEPPTPVPTETTEPPVATEPPVLTEPPTQSVP
jgi:hypothetical protein